MKPWYFAAAPSSVLAATSTFHIALALVRKHRSANPGRGLLLASISALFAIAPWIWTAPAGLAAAIAAHLVWFGISARLGGRKPAAPVRATPRTASPAPIQHPAPAPAATAPAASAPAPAAAAPVAASKPRGFAPVPVLAVFDETPDIRTFRFVRPEGFEFRAGQFLSVQIQIDGRPMTRCYTISSSPGSRGYLEISVRRQGAVSSTLHSIIRPGSSLTVRPPAGAFVYPEGDDRPLVLVSGGVGSTPMISMLRHAVACEPSRPVYYIFSAKTEADIAFRQELALLARRHPQIRVVIALTRESAGTHYYSGRIDEKLIRQVVPDPQQSLFYVCGPAAMIEGTKQLLAGIGVPAAQVRSEAFEAAVKSTQAPAAEPVPVPAPAPVRAPAPVPVAVEAAAARPAPAPRGGRHAMQLSVSRKTAPITPQQTLLEAAETVQVEIPSSCRAGICGTCRTRLVSGEVECTADVLEDNDRAEGFIFPCVAWAKGDCVLEA